MATGLSTVIISIRGLDLFSKPIQQAARSASAEVNRLVRSGDMAGAAMAHSAASVDIFRAKLSILAGQMSSMGLMMTATLTLPVVGAGVAIAKASLDFEKSMRNIQSISRDTDDQTKRLAATFINLSKDITKTVATPQELAEAFYEIQSAGFFGADAEKVLERSTKTATAGLADQVQTAVAVTLALHAYGKGSEEAAHYTDVMMRAVDVGVFRFEDLTNQMGDFIAAAGMMQMPIEQVFAALTTMTKKGLPIDEAATSLNRIMTSYLKPSDKAIDAAASFGVELSAARLKALGFAGAMNEVIKATKGDEGALAAIFPEMRSMRGVFSLGSDGLKMYNEDVVTLTNSLGTVETVFATQVKSFSAQLQNFKNNVTALALSFGNLLMPILTKFVKDYLTPLVQKLDNLNDTTKVTIIRTLALAAATGPLLIIAGQMLTVFSQLFGVFNIFVKGLAPVAGLFEGMSLSVVGTALAITGLVAAIAAFSGGYAAWSRNIFDMQGGLATLAGGNGLLAATATGIQAVYQSMANTEELNAFGESFGILKATLTDLATDISYAFSLFGVEIPSAGEFIGWLIKEIATVSIGMLSLGEQTVLAMAFAVDAIRTLGEPLIDLANTIISVIQLVVELGKGFANLIDGIKTGDFSQLDGLDERLDGIRDTIVATAKSLPNAFKNAVPDFKSVMSEYDVLIGEAVERGNKRLLGVQNINLPAIVNAKLNNLTVAGPQTPDTLSSMKPMSGPATFPGWTNLGWTNPFTGRERDTTPRSVRGGLPGATGTATTVDGLANSVGGLGSKADSTTSAVDDMVTALKGFLDEGVKFSKGLWDFTGAPGGSGNPLEPGANGAFEDIYRIQDIAASKYRGKGTDTDKWMQMYGLNPDQAEEISKKFQQGLVMDPSVMPYINFGALGQQALLEQEAKKQQQALADKLAADTGLGKQVFLSMFGITTDDKGKTLAPDINVGGIRDGVKTQVDALPKDPAIAQAFIGIDAESAKAAANGTVGILLPAFDTSISDNATAIGERGAAYWGKFEDGLITAAKNSGVLYNAVEDMVLVALGGKQGTPPPP